MVDIEYFKRKQQLIELRYNPYHDPSNGRFTSGGGGGGGFLYSPNRKKGEKGMNGDGSAFYVAPDTMDKGEKALSNGVYTKWQNAQDKKKAQAEAEKNSRKVVTYEDPFTHEKVTTEVARPSERLTEKGFKKTVSELDPYEVERLDSISINGVRYDKPTWSTPYYDNDNRQKPSEATRLFEFQSSIGQEVEDKNGTHIEYPIVQVAVDIKTINSKKKGKVQTMKMNTSKSRLSMI
jgi:hypothetical protein